MPQVLLTVNLKYEHDVVQARQRARQVAALLGFDAQDQTRVATAVSEIARNAFRYAGGGKVEFLVDTEEGGELTIRVTDRGGGVADLQAVLDGSYVSATGMGIGIAGAQRLMDTFRIDSTRKGTTVVLGKKLPAKTMLQPPRVAELVAALTANVPQTPFEELQQQNQELMRTMEALHARQEELARLNQELEDTNRGVVALYAELDEKADSLQRANEVKTRFLSNMTHEFRTPLNSILSLSGLLLDRVDGPLSDEQEKQVAFIRRSAEALSDLVNDLLDIAKVEAGKITVKPAPFEIADLFGALRGMLKPLLAANTSVNLVFDEPGEDVPPLDTDEGKVSQILRNFISNALKYTEQGEVRVGVRAGTDGRVVFSVSDTGIGVAPEDRERIFEEFEQVDSPLQARNKGTGLGLPLARRLAQLLGGYITLDSEVGRGSTFSVVLPARYAGPREAAYVPTDLGVKPGRTPVLVLEDDPDTLFIYEKCLEDTEFQALPARSLPEAQQILRQIRPAAVITDILLGTESAWEFIAELRRTPETANLPVIVVTVVDNERKARGAGATAFHLKPVDRTWLLEQLRKARRETILVIDDDEISRYLVRWLLAGDRYHVIEATNGEEGLRLAKTERPAAIVLDLLMPDVNGYETLRRIKADAQLRDIPVIVNTAKRLEDDERLKLARDTVAILNKDTMGGTREHALSAIESALLLARGSGHESKHHGSH